ncbi:UNVERIFIED_CONTAM: hypothetical protein Sangu_2140000, partial [Sesamum angustifolium]
MVDKVYALAIHYRGKCKKLKNIDPDKYSYIDLADIKEVHAGDETVFKITCTMDDRDSNGEGDEWIAENGEDTGGRGSENESDDENISGEDSENESVGEDSGDELSDYKSDEHCEPNNFSDSEFEDDPLHGSLNRDACTLPCETGQKNGVTFQVKTYVPNHTCVRSDPTKEASAEWIASKIESVLRENPGMKARGPFGGVLLAAIGLDGNNGLFPVAFAVESECKESWTFFFENLSMLVGGFSVDKPWTFMSDRQKGLVETINEVVPSINRRCARHIYANFRSQFAGTALKRYFWQAARSYSAAGFNFALYKIKELKPAAYEWLLKIPAEMWSRHAFDPRIKNDHVTNNISESFNHWVGELRSKPILTLVDGLRAKLMSRLQKRKQKGIKWSGLVVPNVVKGLNLVKEESRKCHLLVAGDYEFEVQDENINYIVNLRERTWHNRRTCPNIQVQNSGRDSDLHVPLSKLTRKRKTPPLAGRKRKAAVISSSQPPAPAQVSSSQPLPKKDPVVPSMHAAGSSSQPQPPSYLGAAYLPPSFWRGIGVSPHKEIRSKKHNDAKGANDNETCSQQ